METGPKLNSDSGGCLGGKRTWTGLGVCVGGARPHVMWPGGLFMEAPLDRDLDDAKEPLDGAFEAEGGAGGVPATGCARPCRPLAMGPWGLLAALLRF